MDPFLADFYGTNQSPEEKEKTAQLNLLLGDLEKVAEEENIDLSNFSDEEILQILQDGQTLEEGGGEEDPEALEKEAQEKLAEFDYCGRVMAHSFWQELGNIEKEAAAAGEKYFPAVRKAREEREAAEKGRLRRAGAYLAEKGRGIHEKAMGLGEKVISDKRLASRKGLQKALRGAVGYGAPATAATLGGYGIYRGAKALRGKDKKSADEIVEERAAQFLAEANIDPSSVLEKTAEGQNGYTQEEIDTAALKYLEDLGVPIEWNI
jgi:hypothetical protein